MPDHDPSTPPPNGGRPTPDPVWHAHGSAWAREGVGLFLTTDAAIVEKKEGLTRAGIGEEDHFDN